MVGWEDFEEDDEYEDAEFAVDNCDDKCDSDKSTFIGF